MNESDAFLAAEARRALIGAMNDEARKYAATGNGLCFWRAYRLCRQAGEPVPEELLSYLDDVALALTSADSVQDVARAVQIEPRGGVSPQRHLKQTDESFWIASQVDLLMTLPRPVGFNEACRRVAARRGMSADAVRNVYRRWLRRERPATQKKKQRAASSVFEWGR